MGMHPRWLKADTGYAQTQRTVDRQFLFKPDEAVRNIIGASAARAQQTHPVIIYWLEFNINHEQNGIAALSDSPEHLNNIVRFKQTFHRLLAEELNRYLDRDGGVFSTPARTDECLDNASLEQQFFYAMTNPVKDGLVERVAHWRGFSSYDALALGKDEVFEYYDRTAWNKGGGKRNKKPIQAYAQTARIEYTPLPSWSHMSSRSRQAYIRKEVRFMEKVFRKERELAGRTAMGPARLAKLDPRSRPRSKPERTRKPICHSSCPERAREYEQAFKEFLSSYKKASALYRSGVLDAEFPSGSFRPPLICVCVPGRT